MSVTSRQSCTSSPQSYVVEEQTERGSSAAPDYLIALFLGELIQPFDQLRRMDRLRDEFEPVAIIACFLQ